MQTDKTGSRRVNGPGPGPPSEPAGCGPESSPTVHPRPPIIRSTVHAYPTPGKWALTFWKLAPPSQIRRLEALLYSAPAKSLKNWLAELEQGFLRGQIPEQLEQALAEPVNQLATLMFTLHRGRKLDGALKQDLVQRILELVDDLRDKMPPSINREPEPETVAQELDTLNLTLDVLMKSVIRLSMFLQMSNHAPRPLLRPVPGPSHHASAGHLPPHGIETQGTQNPHPPAPSMDHGFLECRYTGKLGNSA